jgi:hypothetical protein
MNVLAFGGKGGWWSSTTESGTRPTLLSHFLMPTVHEAASIKDKMLGNSMLGNSVEVNHFKF